jgi:hypothetical protein
MEQIVFIGGMGRSGNNMLRNVLDSHSAITAGPEMNIIDDSMALYSLLSSSTERDGTSRITEDEVSQTIAGFMSSMYEPYASRKGKRIVVDRHPDAIWSFPVLAKIFPNAKFINLIRDGRDVACSHRDVGVRATSRGVALDVIRQAAVSSVYHSAAVWAETVKFGWSVCGPESELAKEGRSFTTFYENIVMSPESQIQAICEFLGVEFEPTMLHPERFQHEQTVDGVWATSDDLNAPISMLSAGRWIDHLSLKDRVIFYAAGQSGLEQTGYDGGLEWLFRGATTSVQDATNAVNQARDEIMGLCAKGYPAHVESKDVREPRLQVALEKIISQPVASNGRLLPEFDAVIRNAQEAVQALLGPAR